MNAEAEIHTSTSPLPPPSLSAFELAKTILIDPISCWQGIKSRRESTGDITRNYLVPLLMASVGASFFGNWICGDHGFTTSIILGIRKLVILGSSTFIAAALVDFFTPRFEGRATRTETFGLVTYSLTGVAVPSMLSILPSLTSLGNLLGLYGIYIFYQGVTPMLGISDNRRGAFTGLVLCATVLAVGALLLFARLLAFQP